MRKASGDIGYWLGAEHRGNGYMPKAVRAVTDWVTKHGLLDEPLHWECVVGNTASAITAKKAGFSCIGTDLGRILGRNGEPAQSWIGKYLQAENSDQSWLGIV